MKLAWLGVLSLMSVVLLLPAHGQERPSQKAFKGMELYSWRDSSGDWMFALLPGTNRLKTEVEVKKTGNRIPGVKELEKSFLRLAEGELVLWAHRDLDGLAYPDDRTTADIVSSAKRAKVELHPPPTGK